MGEITVINNGRTKDLNHISDRAASATDDLVGFREIAADEFKGVVAAATGNAVVTTTGIGGEVFGEGGSVDGIGANARSGANP